MKLRKCANKKCNAYNLKERCRVCGSETKIACYKFAKIRDETKIFKRV